MKAVIDNEGYFTLYLSDESFKKVKTGDLELKIEIQPPDKNVYLQADTFPFDLLSSQRVNAGILRIKRPPTGQATYAEGNIKFENKFENKIPLALNIGSSDNSSLVSAKSIRFEKSKKVVYAELYVDEYSWPRFQWYMKIEILDANGKVLDKSEKYTKNRVTNNQESLPKSRLFRFGHSNINIDNARQFRVTLEYVPELEISTNSGHKNSVVEVEGEEAQELIFHGLDLATVPHETDFSKLVDLFEARPEGSKSYEIRGDVDIVYSDLDGAVYFILGRNVFYVQHDKLGSSTLTFYGPFDGHPNQILNLQPAVEVEGEGSITGRCVDSLGRALSNADVSVFLNDHDNRGNLTTVASGRTDEQGHFVISSLKRLGENDQGRRNYIVFVSKDGEAVAWKKISYYQNNYRDLELVAYDTATLSGKVIMEDSGSISGAVVSVRTVIPPGVTEEPTSRRNVLFTTKPLPGWSATTDKDGSFHIEGLPKDGRIQLLVLHTDIAREKIYVKANIDNLIKVRPGSAITGRVIFAKTQEPAANVKVQAQGIKPHDFLETITDDQGLYRLESLLAGTYNIWTKVEGLTVVALDSFEVKTGQTRKAPDLELVEGGFIIGQVIDAESGEPVKPGPASDVGLHGPSRPQSGAAIESSHVKEDGSFRIRVAPGRNYIYLRGGKGWLRNEAEIIPKHHWVNVDEGQTVEVEFKIRRRTESELQNGQERRARTFEIRSLPKTLDELKKSEQKSGVGVEGGEKTGNLIWGEEVNGLRAAVEFLPEKESYWLGERVGVRFHVQNVSDEDIQIASPSFRQGPGVFVQDEQGKEISVSYIVHTGIPRIVRYILKPRETVALEGSGLGLGDAALNEDVSTKPLPGNCIHCGPGRYDIHYELKLPDRANKDGNGNLPVPMLVDWQGVLDTGKRKLVLTSNAESNTKPAVEVEGVQIQLRADKTRSGRGKDYTR